MVKTDEGQLPPPLARHLGLRGWRVIQGTLRASGGRYLCRVERAEARRERLEGAFAIAVLKATAEAHGALKPLAVVSTPRLSARMEHSLTAFIKSYGGGIAWGFFDDAGRVRVQLGKEAIDQHAPPVAVRQPGAAAAGELFSDLNQWLLKVLLADRFPERLLRRAGGGPFRNASVLAEASNVSLPVVTRLLRRLRTEGFLDTSHGYLELQRVPELLARWRFALARGARAEYRVRLRDSSSTPFRWMQRVLEDPSVRATFGLFEAARLLGIRHVSGGPKVIYLDREDSPVGLRLLRDLDLVPLEPAEAADFVVRVPRFPEAVFRASVCRPDEETGGEVIDRYTDVLQTWADVSHHATRGEELAEVIWTELIAPGLEAHD